MVSSEIPARIPPVRVGSWQGVLVSSALCCFNPAFPCAGFFLSVRRGWLFITERRQRVARKTTAFDFSLQPLHLLIAIVLRVSLKEQ
jgi:hypothetical protein